MRRPPRKGPHRAATEAGRGAALFQSPRRFCYCWGRQTDLSGVHSVALTRSPLAPERFPALPAIAGLRFATAACGIKYKGRTDVCLMVLAPGSTVAGVLTRPKTASAPVEWCRAQLPPGRARAILVNSGNANAFPRTSGATRTEERRVGEGGVSTCRFRG